LGQVGHVVPRDRNRQFDYRQSERDASPQGFSRAQVLISGPRLNSSCCLVAWHATRPSSICGSPAE